MEQISETVYTGRKIIILPSEEQKEIFDRYIELYRAVYNWAIEKEYESYNKKEHIHTRDNIIKFYELASMFTKERNSNDYFKEIPLGSARLALKDAIRSFMMHDNGYNRRPGFKSRKRSPLSYKTRKDRCYIRDGYLRLEGFKKGDLVKCSCHLYDGFDGYPGKNLNGFCEQTISKDKDGNYYLSFLYEEPVIELSSPKTEPIGVDLGVRQTFVLSTGEVFNQPDTSKLERKLARQNRKLQKDYARMRKELSRLKTVTGNEDLTFDDIPKSNRCLKRESKRRKTYKKMTDKRMTFYYTTVKNIVTRNPEAVCIETIRTRRIQKENPSMNKIMHGVYFFEIANIFKHNCEKYSVPLIQADEEFPSTQTCSNCGHLHKKIGSKKVFKCPHCGFVIDRDINAAINLRNLYFSSDLYQPYDYEMVA